MVVLIVLLGLGLLYRTMIVVGRRVPGHQVGLENPLFPAFLWIMLQLIDFIYLSYDNTPTLRGLSVNFTEFDIVMAVLVYFIQLFCLLYGINYGLVQRFSANSSVNAAAYKRPADSPIIIYSAAISFATIAVFYFYIRSNGWDISEISARKAQISGDFPLISIMIAMSVISVGYLITTVLKSLPRILALLAVAMLLSWSTGARIHIFILAMFALQALRRKGVSIPVSLAPVMMPIVILFFTVLRSIRAGSGGIQNFFDDRGGVLSSIFGSDEVATAETVTFGLHSLAEHFMYRWPGEGLVGLLISPLPRSAVAWKPYPASSQFTQWLSPGIWEASRSQFTIGGLLEACMEWGVFGSFLYLAAIGLIIGAVLKRVSADSRRRNFAYACVAVMLFSFIRTDMATSGVFFWPMMISALAIIVVERIAPKTKGYRLRRAAVLPRGRRYPARR